MKKYKHITRTVGFPLVAPKKPSGFTVKKVIKKMTSIEHHSITSDECIPVPEQPFTHVNIEHDSYLDEFGDCQEHTLVDFCTIEEIENPDYEKELESQKEMEAEYAEEYAAYKAAVADEKNAIEIFERNLLQELKDRYEPEETKKT